MEPSLLALQKARQDVVQSRVYSKLQLEIQSQLNQLQLESAEEEGQFRSFSSFSTEKKISAVSRVMKELQNTSAYSKLRTKVMSAVDTHFSPLIFESSTVRSSGSLQPAAIGSTSASLTRQEEIESRHCNHHLDKACTRLLKESPHLKHSLKMAVNHPLPLRLRHTAWKMFLHDPTVENDFLLTSSGEAIHPKNSEERRIAQRCQALLTSTPAFRDLAENKNVLTTMQSVMLYWSQRTGSTVLDAELFLCVPFIYTWREELERQRKREREEVPEVGGRKRKSLQLVAEIAGQYVHFMEILPPSVAISANAQQMQGGDALDKFSQKVEELLYTEDPALYTALHTIFIRTCAATSSAPPQHKKRWRVKRGEGASPSQLVSFHQSLKSVIVCHVQRMLVGDLSMDVLCYVWDQCFIGLDTPEYQCLPYFVTVWLILLRTKLISCQTMEAIEEVLSVHSLPIKTIQFQNEVESRFLHHLSSLLKVKPHPLQPSHPSTPAEQGADSEDRTSRPLSRVQDTTPVRERDKRVDEIEKKVEEEQRAMSSRFKEERQKYQQQLEMLMKEIKELKGPTTCGSSQKGVVRSPPAVHSPPAVNSSAVQHPPTLLLVDPNNMTNLNLTSNVTTQGAVSGLHVVPVSFNTEQSSGTAARGRRAYSPSHLSQQDVQQLWLNILKKFTSATCKICHGTGTERQDLYATTQPRSP